jgi:hypothetical protein
MGLVIPGYDSKNGNTNSVLYKTYKTKCSQYVLDQPLEDQYQFIDSDSKEVIVHSYGFFIFLVGYKLGLFKNTSLVVIDGWFPKDCKFNGTEYKIELPPIPTVFLFPTFGDRKDYPLEAIVRQAMTSRKDITVVRAIGFGHNLLFGSFDEHMVADLVLALQCLPEKRLSDVDIKVNFPDTTLINA